MLAPVFVTGVGRCGTSMVASVLDALGFDMGESLPPDGHNPRGYFEDQEFVTIHEGVLQETLSWQTAEAAIHALAERRIAKQVPWGIKDPRLSYFVTHYAAMFPYARWIICHRHPVETIKSYQATYLLDEESCRKIMDNRWMLLTNALSSTAGLIVFHVRYEEILKHPEVCIDRLRVFLGLPIDAARDLTAAQRIDSGRPAAMTRAIPAPQNMHALRNMEHPLYFTPEGVPV